MSDTENETKTYYYTYLNKNGKEMTRKTKYTPKKKKERKTENINGESMYVYEYPNKNGTMVKHYKKYVNKKIDNPKDENKRKLINIITNLNDNDTLNALEYLEKI